MAQSADAVGERAVAARERVAEIEKLPTANEFVVAVRDYWKTGRTAMDDTATESLKKLLSEASKRRLLAAGDLSTLAIGDMSELVGWAAPVLSSEERQTLSARAQELLAMKGDGEADRLDRAVSLLQGIGGKDYRAQAPARKAVADWLDRQDFAKQSRTRLEWCYRVLSPSIRGEDGFSVVWTGLLTPPTSGAYTFSTSDLKISCELNEGGHSEYHRQYLTVKVGDQTVLEATPQQWPATSKPIELKAGAAEALHVEFRYERNDSFKACPAVLYWEGPGFKRSVVPTSVLTAQGPTGKVPGLLGTYSWKSKLADGSVATTSDTSIDPNIDFVWTEKVTVGAHSGALGSIGKDLARRWKESPREFVDEVARRPAVVSTLSSSDLTGCLAALHQSEVLKDIDATRFWRFWVGVRDTGGRDAVDSVGLWMHSHAFQEHKLIGGIEEFWEQHYRMSMRYADFFGFERPDLLQKLNEDYLVLESGACCLPVACVYGFSLRQKGRLEDWIEEIDSYLADKSVDGDVRSTWFVAKAMAYEHLHGSTTRMLFGPPRPLAGEQYLHEAVLSAKSSDAKRQAIIALASRYAARGLIGRAEKQLNKLSDSESWLTQLRELEVSAKILEAFQKQKIQDTYRITIQKRLEDAQAANDRESVTRFQSILDRIASGSSSLEK